MRTSKNKIEKRTKWIVLLLTTLLIFMQACSKDDSNPLANENLQAISDEEAAEIIASELSTTEAQYGVAAVSNDIAYIAQNGDVSNIPTENGLNGYSVNDTTIVLEDNIPPYQYYLSLTYGYDFLLNGYKLNSWLPGVDTMNVSYSSEGNYEVPKISGSRTVKAPNIIVNGLKASSVNLFINGEYDWISLLQFETDEQTKQLNVTGKIKLKNIAVSKTTQQIIGGTADVHTEAVTGSGDSYVVDASVIFLGNFKAKVTINGVEYLVDLETGKVI